MRAAVLSLAIGSPCLADTLTLTTPGQTRQFTLDELRARLEVHGVTVDDPVAKARKQYEGFLLQDLLKLLAPEGGQKDFVFQLKARDHYESEVTLDDAIAHRGVLAFRNRGAPSLANIVVGDRTIELGPFYLVWPGNSSHLPWPYQVTVIELTDAPARSSARLRPRAAKPDSVEMKGFELFLRHCRGCHSINARGGGLGPELNAPMNVTEYWDEAVLKTFIRNPLDVRYTTKMPSFPQLSDAEVNQLVAYLKTMRTQKYAPVSAR